MGESTHGMSQETHCRGQRIDNVRALVAHAVHITRFKRSCVRGILKLAYKLLVNDKAKFTALLVGITFAVFLMIAMTSLFAGVLNRASATVINLGASLWVMDPSVQTVANTIGMPDYVLDAARSMRALTMRCRSIPAARW